MPRIELPDLNIEAATKKVAFEALRHAGSITDAAVLLGVSRHALQRLIARLQIPWPPPRPSVQKRAWTRRKVSLGAARVRFATGVGEDRCA